MQEAMKKVRDEMGPDAVILQTRTLQGGFFGLFSKGRVEITAAADVAIREPELNQPAVTPAEHPKEAANTSKTPKTSASESVISQSETDSEEGCKIEVSDTAVTASRLTRLEDKIAKLTETVEQLVEKSFSDRARLPGRWMDVFQNLLVNGMDEVRAHELCEELIREFEDAQAILDDDRDVIGFLSKTIQAEGGIELPESGQKVVVMVGPTGVGKTTTLAKIASRFLQQDRSMAFVTADTYRLAAIEQLQKYADIMSLPLETVFSPEEVSKAIEKHSDKDLILVDTAGRSQRNNTQVEELKALIAACQPAEVHLLASATTKREDLKEILHCFSVCDIDRLILTKSDESTCFGPFLCVAKDYAIPFSYITTGQNVPEDIEEATSEKIARLIWRGTLESEESIELVPVESKEDEAEATADLQPVNTIKLTAD
jgi:flagellar biosynthesis protein FlhF